MKLKLIILFFIVAVIGCNSCRQQAGVAEIIGNEFGDLGNGTYLNPIFPGDFPDPSILRDGNDYYMTHTSHSNYPGLIIWHSKDLVNWRPIANALK